MRSRWKSKNTALRLLVSAPRVDAMLESRMSSLIMMLIGVLTAVTTGRAEEFYKGKSFTIVVGFSPGSGHDTYAHNWRETLEGTSLQSECRRPEHAGWRQPDFDALSGSDRPEDWNKHSTTCSPIRTGKERSARPA